VAKLRRSIGHEKKKESLEEESMKGNEKWEVRLTRTGRKTKREKETALEVC
jgi:hypothetical protein